MLVISVNRSFHLTAVTVYSREEVGNSLPYHAPDFFACLPFALDTTVKSGRTANLGALSLSPSAMVSRTLSEKPGARPGGDGAEPFSPCALRSTSEKRAPRLRTFDMASVLYVPARCMKMLMIFLQLPTSTIVQTTIRYHTVVPNFYVVLYAFPSSRLISLCRANTLAVF